MIEYLLELNIVWRSIIIGGALYTVAISSLIFQYYFKIKTPYDTIE